MNRKLLSKVLATTLVMTLTLTNFILLGVYASNSYATSNSLEQQGKNTNNENVEFDAYFKGANGNTIHSTSQDIHTQDAKLYLQVKVKKGYLKDANINVLGDAVSSVANFKMLNSNESLEFIQKLDIENNRIELKQFNQGTEVVLEIPIVANTDTPFDLSNFSKENQIRLTGSYIDDQGKSISIEKVIKVRNEWNGIAKAIVEQNIQRYIPFQIADKKGILLQTAIRTGLENNTLPIAETNIEVVVPVINGMKPEKVNVMANQTKATNGQDGLSFNQNNWNYDAETGKITIQVKNEAQENKVMWIGNVKDEYIVTYVFPQEAIVGGGIQGSQTVTSKIKAYNNVATEVEETTSGNIQLTQTIGEMVSSQITSLQEALSKGYLYNTSEKETEYKVKMTTEVGYAELIDGMTVENMVDNFANEKGETAVAGNSYYKSTSISKENFEKLLGQEGSIAIKDQDGATLITFHKDTQPDENGNFVYEYVAHTNKITIQTSKPVAEGKLEFEHVKALTGNSGYAKEQIANFKTLKMQTATTVIASNITLGTSQSEANINLVDPVTKVELGLSTNSLSTVVKNENVEMRVILKTNDITCDLYKNPVIEMVLPNYVEDITIKDINLLFDDELKIKNHQVTTNATGNKVIRVEIEGEDTKYNQDEISKGANLVLNTDIVLKQLTPTKQDSIKVYVTNENATTYEYTEPTRARSAIQKGYVEIGLKAVAPVGMVTTNAITGYNAKNETVNSISGQEQIGKLETREAGRVATITGNVINNYNNVVNNISILGRIPFEGNKDAATNKDFASNLTTPLAGSITVTGATVYYSTNAEATKEVANTANGWTTTPTDFASIKSYLIVFNNHTMNTGDNISFDYQINIPADLSYNKTTSTNYVVYFDNVATEGTTSEKVVATKVGLSTGEGPELETTMKASIANGAEVEEGTIITYTATVKNVGKKEVKNITVTGNVPQGTIYTEYIKGDDYQGEEYIGDGYVDDHQKKTYSQNIASLAAGQSITVEYKVRVDTLYTEKEFYIETAMTVTAEGLEKPIITESIKNKIVEGYFYTEMATYPDADNGIVRENQIIRYTTLIENVGLKERNNVVVKSKIPEGTSYKEAYILTEDKTTEGVEYDEASRTVTWNLGKLAAKVRVRIVLQVETNKLDGSENRLDIKNKAEITCEGTDRVFTTNEVSNYIVIPTLQATHKSNRPDGKMTDEDTIEYYINVKNIGKAIAKDVTIKDFIPEGLTYESSKYVINGKTTEFKSGTDIATVKLDILAGQEVEVTIVARANKVIDADSIEVENIVTVECAEADDVPVNSLKHIIEATQQDIIDPDGNVTEKTYRITGGAWLDSNKDGKKDESEPTLGGIQVMLINAEDGSIVKDKSGNSRIITTDENGKYVFEELPKGKYMVVFLYDAGQYDITTYKANGINESENSDAITMKISYNGTLTTGGVSDALTIVDANVYNIDIGLVVNPKFDLKLDKVISKITVNDAKGTTVHEYKDTKLAKLDFNPKTINGTTIVIEYKIRVTNEGGIAGYAKKIVDYLPSNMKFNSELNKEWYTNEKGDVYNTSLANTLIQPGETKELTLLLTKTMTEDNTDVINNRAEIYEAYNDLGKADIDSTPANKVQGEDDMSSVDAVLGIKTGEVYIYITVTLLSIAILGVGIYFINKKVLRKI